MKTEITPDSTNRIVLTKEMRQAAGICSGEPLEISVQLGAILITPKPKKGKVVKKGRLKVFSGNIPDVDLAEAVERSRHYSR